ncbi:MAG: aminotransferase class I/II-fold pyridoxal phosphate-dependent enzyme [Actinobacteria bacterium]|nr:aminotransferase class I/II-fold pyridoxal phosphate-dependent enzyme [Actinomycetota bacterium]MSZ00337.1 aminotransferase class I/II-fold pyridoxal phosphate-dependent enzyme [Actinomycetota bacterium]MSZ62189.1 aminotransferase class I/II-fold pyridoxal phosphate-dependent enzyme [Actinomycetota bacterium]
MEGVRPSAIRDLLKLGDDPGLISFGGGYPDPSLFPIQELNQIYSSLLVPERSDVLQYTSSNGLPGLRAIVAHRLTRDGMSCTENDILIIQGAQQGLDISAKLVVNPGDTIVTENPTFLGALIAFAPTQPNYAPVRTDEFGMDTDQLAEVLATNPNVVMIYTIPEFQNPTGVTMNLERRKHLIELANKYNVLVVEDSAYRELRYVGEQLPTIKSLDTEGRVIHLGSFSKILAPSMRLGWALASPEILDKLSLLKLASDTQNSTLNMNATLEYLRRHSIDEHIAKIRPNYLRKLNLMLSTMRETFPNEVSFTEPEGGLFTWLTFPVGFDATNFMKETLLPKGKVAYVPGATFFPVLQEPNHARVNFSGVEDDRIVEGISRIGKLLKQTL